MRAKGKDGRDVSALNLFKELAPRKWVEVLSEDHGIWGSGIYTPYIVIWLMTYQWLEKKGTLEQAIYEALQGATRKELPNHKRVREGTISSNTGAYSIARGRVPVELVEEVVDHVIQQLSREKEGLWEGRRAYLLDGTTLQLESTKELRKKFPPAENQHGQSHWPIMHLALATNMMTAVCQRPEYGAMYGSKAVSETALGREVMKRLEAGSIVVADRNFGIFSVAHAATELRHDVLFRLTDDRAQRLYGKKLPRNVDVEVVWCPSRWDLKKNPEIPGDAKICGRLIRVHLQGGGKNESLVLFTTLLDTPAAELVELYRRRWGIELDIRSLKQTLNMSSLPGKTTDIVVKELLMGIVAYNIIREVMKIAAEIAKVDPRRMSFSRITKLLKIAGNTIAGISKESERQNEFSGVLRLAAQAKLPNRKKRRSYPRQVLQKTRRYTVKKTQVENRVKMSA